MLQQKLHRERLEKLVNKSEESSNQQQQQPQISIINNPPSVNKLVPPLPVDLSTLNINPQPKVNMNISIASITSSKLKQENSFDVFDLINTHDDNRTTKYHSGVVSILLFFRFKANLTIFYFLKLEQKIPKQQQNIQFNSVPMVKNNDNENDDEDESKLFEDIFFVN
jgi:hypothetical protein